MAAPIESGAIVMAPTKAYLSHDKNVVRVLIITPGHTVRVLRACCTDEAGRKERLRSYGSLALGESLTSLMTEHAHSRNVDLYM